jgi:hypothetical protein
MHQASSDFLPHLHPIRVQPGRKSEGSTALGSWRGKASFFYGCNVQHKFRFLLLAVALISVASAKAQFLDSLAQRDSLQRKLLLTEQERARLADTSRRASTKTMYDRAKRESRKTIVGRAIYDILFREPPNPLRAVPSPSAAKQTNQKYRRLNGHIIRKIRVTSLDVFGPKVFDPQAAPRNFAERAGNAIHRTTRQHVITSQLEFKEGDRFTSASVSNNERILRQTGYYADARIVPNKIPGTDSVDLYVITQDIFSTSADVGFGNLGNFSAQIQERNFLGQNHTARIRYEYNNRFKLDHNFRGYYLIPYLIPGSFVSAEAEGQYYYFEQGYRFRIFRDFLFVDTRWAGSAQYSRGKYAQGLFASSNPQTDTAIVFNIGRGEFDGWLGRSFPIMSGSKQDDERVRFIISGRLISGAFFSRPFASTDSNQIFLNRTLALASFGYSDRDYFRDVLINGYGRTEDVPFGSSLTLTAGTERFTGGVRQYGGVRYAKARFIRGFGYLSLIGEAGSFLNYTSPEQGAFRAELYSFSRLFALNRLNFRHFLRIRYLEGYHRFANEFLNINNENGIRGLSAAAFIGQRSFIASAETVAFINFDLLSFKTAPFLTVDAGWVSDGRNLFLRAPYMGFGAGLRLFNERLSIQTFQIRLNYYPNIPQIADPLRIGGARNSPFRLNDFSINQPQVIGLTN